jgi:hypothetical protein
LTTSDDFNLICYSVSMLYIWSKAGITAAAAAISEMKYCGGPGRLVGLGRVADEGRYHGCCRSDSRRSDRYVWPSDHGYGGDSTVRGTWRVEANEQTWSVHIGRRRERRDMADRFGENLHARGGGEHELGTRKGWRVAFFDMTREAWDDGSHRGEEVTGRRRRRGRPRGEEFWEGRKHLEVSSGVENSARPPLIHNRTSHDFLMTWIALLKPFWSCFNI